MTKRFWGIALLVAALFVCGSALADLQDFYVTTPDSPTAAESTQEYKPLDRVDLFKKGSTYYLFLPASWDASELKVWFSDAESIKIGKQTFHSGDVCDKFAVGRTITIKEGKNSYSVKVMQANELPAVFLATESGSVEKIHASKTNKEAGQMMILKPDGQTEYHGALSEIKIRGNYTATLDKKPYQIKLDEKADLFGMGKHKTWILLADHSDVSLLRNKITFAMARAVNMPYTNHACSVNVYVNGSYSGVYLLTEKVQIGDNRVELADLEGATEDLNETDLEDFEAFSQTVELSGAPVEIKGRQIENVPEDITGGYLLELELPDRYVGEASGFVTSLGQPVVVKEPEYASEEMVAYAAEKMEIFHRAIDAKNGKDPATGLHYTQIMDLDSLVRKYIIEEIVKNYDGNKTSQFFYKDADSQDPLIYAGPVWDYDVSYGLSIHSPNLRSTSHFYVSDEDEGEDYYIWPKLYKQPDFYKRVVEIYNEEFAPVLKVLIGKGEETEDLKSIKTYAAELRNSAKMNFVRWSVSDIKMVYKGAGKDFNSAVDYLQRFVSKRMNYLNKAWKE